MRERYVSRKSGPRARRAVVDEALGWLAPTIDARDAALVARVQHPDEDALTALIEVRSDRFFSETSTLALTGLLPPSLYGSLALTSERGLIGYLRSIADRRMGFGAIDNRFLIDGDMRLARECIPVADALGAIDDMGPTCVRLDGAKVVLTVRRIAESSLADALDRCVRVWIDLASRRLGLVAPR